MTSSKKKYTKSEPVYLWPVRGGIDCTCDHCGTPCLIIHKFGKDVILDSTTKDWPGKAKQYLQLANEHTKDRCRKAQRKATK